MNQGQIVTIFTTLLSRDTDEMSIAFRFLGYDYPVWEFLKY